MALQVTTSLRGEDTGGIYLLSCRRLAVQLLRVADILVA